MFGWHIWVCTWLTDFVYDFALLWQTHWGKPGWSSWSSSLLVFMACQEPRFSRVKAPFLMLVCFSFYSSLCLHQPATAACQEIPWHCYKVTFSLQVKVIYLICNWKLCVNCRGAEAIETMCSSKCIILTHIPFQFYLHQQSSAGDCFTWDWMSAVLMAFAVRFRTTSGLDSAVDPIQMKNVTFEHVKGVEEAKNELQDVVEFLRNPQKFTALGGKLPKGMTLPYALQNEHVIYVAK